MKNLIKISKLFVDEDFTDITLPVTVKIQDLSIQDQADVAGQICVSEKLSPVEVVAKLNELKASCLVQKRQNFFKADLLRSVNFVIQPQEYFNSNGQVLLKDGNLIFEEAFTCNEDKSRVFDVFEEVASNLKSQNVTDSARSISEELFMNAIYDAPRESKSNGIGDSESFNNGKKAVLRIFKSENRLLITCEDPFGSMKLARMLERMQEVYQKGAGQAMNMRENSGAGIGSVIVFEHCESLFVGVEPGQKTLVCCLLPLGLSLRQRDSLNKSIHVLEFNQSKGGKDGKS